MGYDTRFNGTLTLNKKLSDVDSKFIKKLSDTRRMKLDITGFGVDGEFYVEDDDNAKVLDSNEPPQTQPSLWCNLIPTDDDLGLQWTGNEKTYEMEKWICYIINRYLEPRGYVVNGMMECIGEGYGDLWVIKVDNNEVYIQQIVGITNGINDKNWELVNPPNMPKLPLLIA